jgi:hypothetical protein
MRKIRNILPVVDRRRPAAVWRKRALMLTLERAFMVTWNGAFRKKLRETGGRVVENNVQMVYIHINKHTSQRHHGQISPPNNPQCPTDASITGCIPTL